MPHRSLPDIEEHMRQLVQLSSTPAKTELLAEAELQLFHKHSIRPILYSECGYALFTFDQLCRQPHSATDYIALAKHLHTVHISGVCALDPEDDANDIRRFISLIDVFYERGIKVVFDAEVPPLRIFKETPPRPQGTIRTLKKNNCSPRN